MTVQKEQMTRAHILVVEDETIVAMDIENQLLGLGYEVSAVVYSGEEAVQISTAQRPDLVLMDIMLEGEIDGIEASEIIRTRLDIPVVFLSAYADNSTLQRAKRTGPFGYVLKPFEERELYVAIECALCRHEMEKEAEAKKAAFEEQLRQSQKMDAVGQLIAGVAHNFNNALAVVMGNIELLLLRDAKNPNLRDAEVVAGKAAGMVKQLMLFSQQATYEHKPVRFQILVESIAEMCRGTFDRKIDIDLKAPGNLPLVRGDEGQLRQAFLSLFINARDALEKLARQEELSPWIRIALSTLRYEEPGELGHLEARLGRYVRVDVSDNGSGMDTTLQQRIFEPFFTTKEVGQGTGLGLATVYAVIKEHGGWIECESAPGKGSRFSVCLPALELEEAEAEQLLLGPEEEQADEYPVGKGETILIVEDEELVNRTLATMLREFGYSVLLSENGEEGLEVFKRRGREIDLILLDLFMPRMSGREVMEKLLVFDPQVRIIIATGYPSEQIELEGARAVLEKPFQIGKLVQTVHQVLNDQYSELGS